MDGFYLQLMPDAMNQLGAIEYGGGRVFSSSRILSLLDWNLLAMPLGYDEDPGREASLLKLNALLATPVMVVAGRNKFCCVSSAAGSSFKASS